MEKFDISIHGNAIYVHDASRHVTPVADATGLRQWNRGERIRDKWKAVVRRGYVKMHLPADADTGTMLAAVVTDGRTGDSPVLRDLPDQAAAEPLAKTGKGVVAKFTSKLPPPEYFALRRTPNGLTPQGSILLSCTVQTAFLWMSF